MIIYLSYARSDRARAEEISEALRQLGHEVYLDFDLLPGDAFTTLIRERIETSDLVVVLWSQRSRESNWVRAEALLATEQNKYVGILLDRLELPVPFNVFNHLSLVDVSGGEVIEQLAKALPTAARRAGARRRPTQNYEQSVDAFETGASRRTSTQPLDPPAPTPAAPQTPASPESPNTAPRPYDVFISYSRKDEPACKALFDLLVQRGLNPWYDKDLGSGAFKAKIFERISSVSVFALLLSKNSTASPNVSKELSMASQAGRLIVPISIDGTQATDLKDTFAFELVELNILPVSSAAPDTWTSVAETIEGSVRELSKFVPSPPPIVATITKNQRRRWPFGWIAIVALLALIQLGAIGGVAYRIFRWSLLDAALAVASSSVIVLLVLAATSALLRNAFEPRT